MLIEEKLAMAINWILNILILIFLFWLFYIFQKNSYTSFGYKTFYMKKRSYSVVQQFKINGLHASQLINPGYCLFFSVLIAPLSCFRFGFFVSVFCVCLCARVFLAGPISPTLDPIAY